MFVRLFETPSILYLAIAFAVLSLLTGMALVVAPRNRFTTYLRYLWIVMLAIVTAAAVSLAAAAWILAVLSFWTLREYFSLVDIRIQDRIAILGAYLSVPFMTWFIQIDWYGMFIISIPVYTFLAIPLLVAIGGNDYRGTVFSIGVIDLGLFLCVYCLGHIAYLMSLSVAWAVLFVACVAVCDLLCRVRFARAPRYWQRLLVWYIGSVPATLAISFGLAAWTGVPARHNAILGLLIPALVIAGHHTLMQVERDLGIEDDRPRPGHGQLLDNLRSVFYAGPIVFHYLRYFIH